MKSFLSLLFGVLLSLSLIAQPCQSNFYWYQDSSTTQTVIAINNSTVSSAATYMWDFGDGNTSNLAYPTHQYSQLGTYNICLTIIDSPPNATTCTSVFCDSVFVTFKMSGFTFNVYPESVLQSTEEALNDFSIYPNPSNGILNIKLQSFGSEKEIKIANIEGKIVHRSIANKDNIELNLSFLKPGAYFVSLDGFITKMVLIE